MCELLGIFAFTFWPFFVVAGVVALWIALNDDKGKK